MVAILIIIIKKIFFNKESDKIKQINSLVMDGIRNEKIKEYQTAIYFFKKVCSLTKDRKLLRDTYFAIAGCYYNLKRYNDSLNYCNKSLEINLDDNLVALLMKSHCNLKLGNLKDHLRDLVLYDSFLSTAVNKKKIEDLYNVVSGKEADEYCNNNLLPYSEEKYCSFFKTLIGVLPSDEDDEVVYLIKHKKYQQLDDFFFKGDHCLLKSIENTKKTFNRNLIHACLFYLKGKYNKAIELLNKGQSNFERLFLEYVLTVVGSESTCNGVLRDKQFVTSSNPSIIYYIAKVHYYRKDYDEYLHFMSRLLDYSFAYSDLLVFFDDKNDETKFRDFSCEGLEKFKGDRQIHYICAYHYYVTNQLDLLEKIVGIMSDDDPNKHFIGGLVQQNNSDVFTCLKKAIKVDPTHHNAYLFLTNALIESNNEEYREYSIECLKRASCHDEVAQSYKILLMIANNDYLKEVKNK